jgi:site-specific DNA recombinase
MSPVALRRTSAIGCRRSPGSLATFAEYYSNNLATEIMKGLRRKHEQGGTPHRPPIGYLSKRELIGNQDIRSVIVDETRAPLIKEAFSLYATGQWTLLKLAAYLWSRRGCAVAARAAIPNDPCRPAAFTRCSTIPTTSE